MNVLRSQPRRRGFTLIELVLVLLLLAVVAAAAAPALGGWGRGQRLGNAADELVATVRWARMKSVSDGAAVRLECDADGTHYLVSELAPGGDWRPVDAEQGISRAVGEKLSLRIDRADGGDGSTISLWPNGRISPVRVTITSERGDTKVLACEGAADPLREVQP